jgi:hypothetical protein
MCRAAVEQKLELEPVPIRNHLTPAESALEISRRPENAETNLAQVSVRLNFSPFFHVFSLSLCIDFPRTDFGCSV